MTQRKYYEPGVWVDSHGWMVGILDIGPNHVPDDAQIYSCKVFFMDRDTRLFDNFGGDPKDTMVAPKELVAWQD